MKKRNYVPLFLLLLLSIQNIHAQDAKPTEAALITGQQQRHHLMPVPMALNFRPGKLAINNSFNVALKSFKDARLQAGIERAENLLETRPGFARARGWTNDPANAPLVIESLGPGKATGD